MVSQLWLNLERRDVTIGTNASVLHKHFEVTTPEPEKGRVSGREPTLIVTESASVPTTRLSVFGPGASK